jgi:hypothetical protein
MRNCWMELVSSSSFFEQKRQKKTTALPQLELLHLDLLHVGFAQTE